MKVLKYTSLGICALLSVAVAAQIFNPLSPGDISVTGQADGVVYAADSIPVQTTRTDSDNEKDPDHDDDAPHPYMTLSEERYYSRYRWSEILGHLYSNVPDSYDDPALRSVAAMYYEQGFYLLDKEFQLHKLGYGDGYDDYIFTCGFNVLDKDLGGGMNTIASVMKATYDEYESYLLHFDPVILETKEDDDVITVLCDYYTLIYDRDTEVLIFKLNDPANMTSVG